MDWLRQIALPYRRVSCGFPNVTPPSSVARVFFGLSSHRIVTPSYCHPIQLSSHRTVIPSNCNPIEGTLPCCGEELRLSRRWRSGPVAGRAQAQVGPRPICTRSSCPGAVGAQAQVHVDVRPRCRWRSGPGAGIGQAHVQVDVRPTCRWGSGPGAG